MKQTLPILVATVASLSAAEPLRQTGIARLWLTVPAGQAPLRDLQLSKGSASIATSENGETTADVTFPIRWWGWDKITITFTSPDDGKVALILSGPWAEEKPGTVFRQEILWDGITAEGTTVRNGGFESRSDEKPEDWDPIYQPYLAPGSWPLANAEPLDGKSIAASCHARPLSQDLKVSAGQTVTLHLHARAATLPDFQPPKLLGSDTPAHRAAARIRRGVNLGNCWDTPPPYSQGVRYSTKDIDNIASEGFDHIRVPVAFAQNMKPTEDGYEIDPALVADLEPVLRHALEKRMSILLDWVNFDDLMKDPGANRDRFVSMWASIARHFKSWPPAVYFELHNEPHGALTTEVANPIFADAAAAIRKVDPQRIILVSPGNWSDIRELEKLRLPDSDDRIIVTVHCYDPMFFTHQGAKWVNLGDLKGIVYPGPPATPFVLTDHLRENAAVREFIQGYNTLPADRNPCSPNKARELLDDARAWSEHFGRPVHLGEFGSYETGDDASRSRYTNDVRLLAEQRGIPWTYWDWKAGFGYWNPETNQPRFRNSLFKSSP